MTIRAPSPGASGGKWLGDDPIYLYILMRTDVVSMNPGKAVAQGAHAANLCIETVGSDDDSVIEWSKECGGFGTTITLAVNGDQLVKKIALAKEYDLAAQIVHDPTYPIRDGEVTHLIPFDTCGYVFGRQSTCQLALGDLELMA